MEKTLEMLRSSQPATLVVAGDSNSVISHNTAGRANWVSLLQEALWARYGDGMATVVNTSVCGDKFRRLSGELHHRVVRWRPDLVVLPLGMNDAAAGVSDLEAWSDVVRGVIDAIRRETGAEILVCTSNPVVLDFQAPLPPGAEPGVAWEQGERAVGAYAGRLAAVAREMQCAVCDHYSAWTRHCGTFAHAAADPRGLRLRMSDAIHPNAIGHLAFYRELATLFDLPKFFPWEVAG
jgi:lysophospholipase L1-like esterase